MALDLCRSHKLGNVGIPWLGYLGVDKIIKAAIGASRLFLGGIRFFNLWPGDYLAHLSGCPDLAAFYARSTSVRQCDSAAQEL
jgi:hypothetical protein